MAEPNPTSPTLSVDYGQSPGQIIFMNKWYIQLPLHLILLEVLVACILRIIYAIVLINKYRHKREECYRPPILDDNYYGGGDEKNQLPPAKKEEAPPLPGAPLPPANTSNPPKK